MINGRQQERSSKSLKAYNRAALDTEDYYRLTWHGTNLFILKLCYATRKKKPHSTGLSLWALAGWVAACRMLLDTG